MTFTVVIIALRVRSDLWKKFNQQLSYLSTIYPQVTLHNNQVRLKSYYIPDQTGTVLGCCSLRADPPQVI